MKLLKLDSSLNARKQLAQELGYTGALNGSAEMNIWLHKQVMTKLAESGGKVPDSLKTSGVAGTPRPRPREIAMSGIIWIIVIGFIAGIIARFLSPGPNDPKASS